MKFVFRSKAILTINDELISELTEDLEKLGFESESGGIILGSFDPNRNEYRITSFTRPTAYDERSPFFFIRSKDPANDAIEQAWKDSEGTINYLGEWHTHNEVTPHPSSTDKALMRQIIEDESCVYEECFMIIFGSGGGIFCGEVERGGDGSFKDKQWSVWN